MASVASADITATNVTSVCQDQATCETNVTTGTRHQALVTRDAPAAPGVQATRSGPERTSDAQRTRMDKRRGSRPRLQESTIGLMTIDDIAEDRWGADVAPPAVWDARGLGRPGYGTPGI
ncbi:hypothetical protein GCM10027203_13480 [Nonomuraea fastidiosa]|jgi:hypothetical protein